MAFFSKVLFRIGREVISKVLPDILLAQNVGFIKGTVTKMIVPSNNIDVELTGRVFVIGVGKGALSLACGLNKKFEESQITIARGLICIPEGNFGLAELLPAEFKLIKAAPFNVPDSQSALAGTIIVQMLSELQPDDLLIVLITGGGSALVTSPVPPVTMNDMVNIVKALHMSGAPIEHLNYVRQQLDFLKAGGMGFLAYPSRVVAFILSDVIGSDLGVIASGPTSLKMLESEPKVALQLLEQYSLTGIIPPAVFSFLKTSASHPSSRLSQLREMSRMSPSSAAISSLSHINNVLIGSNADAIMAAHEALRKLGIPSFTVDDSYDGDAATVGRRYANLAYYGCHCLCSLVSGDEKIMLASKTHDIPLFPNLKEKIICTAQAVHFPDSQGHSYYTIAFVSGGESTVFVKGPGKGGRNQESALAASIALDELWQHRGQTDKNAFANILFFSTDGQDGPTEATGAIATPEIVSLAALQNLNPEQALDNNDSFTFWSSLADGSFQFNTGRTGTNVADVIIVIAAIELKPNL